MRAAILTVAILALAASADAGDYYRAGHGHRVHQVGVDYYFTVGRYCPPVPTPEKKVEAKPVAADAGLAALVETKCLACHGGPKGVKGKVDLRDLPSVSLSVRKEAYKQVQKGLMPHKSDPLSEAEADTFLDWLTAPVAAQTK